MKAAQSSCESGEGLFSAIPSKPRFHAQIIPCIWLYIPNRFSRMMMPRRERIGGRRKTLTSTHAAASASSTLQEATSGAAAPEADVFFIRHAGVGNWEEGGEFVRLRHRMNRACTVASAFLEGERFGSEADAACRWGAIEG